jgi:hypothetical protein
MGIVFSHTRTKKSTIRSLQSWWYSASFRYVGFPFVQYLENVCLIVLDVRAVEILLNIGVKYTCLKCNGTFYWKDNIKENEIDEIHMVKE